MKLTILGCGASGGVPIFAGQWGACRPDNPRNRRRRCAALVENADTRVLIDTPPELRQQLLDSDTTWLSATLFTHAHADHLHGIDDLRGINRSMRAPIPIYGTPETLENIRTRFGYVLAAPDGTGRIVVNLPQDPGLVELLTAFANPNHPYLSAPRPERIVYESAYSRLARRNEWTGLSTHD